MRKLKCKNAFASTSLFEEFNLFILDVLFQLQIMKMDIFRNYLNYLNKAQGFVA